MRHDDKHDRKHEPGRAIAARFASAAEAREAVRALHGAHYSHTWLGATSVGVDSAGSETLTVETDGGMLAQPQGIVDALVSQGVFGDTARSIEQNVEPGDALVTVEPKDRDVHGAIALLEEHGGIVEGPPFTSDVATWAAQTDSARRVTPPFER